MAFVSAGDYERILDIVGEAAWGTDDEPLSRSVLERIQDLTGAGVVSLYSGVPWDRAARRVWTTPIAPVTPEESRVADAFRFQMPLNPSPQTLGRAVRISDRMNRRQYWRLDLYQLLGKPRHIEFAMDYWFRAANDSMWGLCLDGFTRDFDDRARDAVELLGRQLSRLLGRFDLSTPEPTRGVLSPRQAQIMRLVSHGRTNSQIAHALGISPHTVRTHIENAFAALGVHTRAEAVARIGGLS
jgi:DNA-binding CsgD family transcriptional regulator